MRTVSIVGVAAIAALVSVSFIYYGLSGQPNAQMCLEYMIEGSSCQRMNGAAMVRYIYKGNSSSTLDGDSHNSPIAEKTSNEEKLILGYTTLYGHKFNVSHYYRAATEKKEFPNALDACKYRCRWSTNLSDYNISDAVIFHLYNNLDRHDFVLRNLPIRQSEYQKWILMIREPQAFYYPQQLKLLNNRFNLTATFLSSSDVHLPYGKFFKLPSKLSSAKGVDKMGSKYFAQKSKMALWLASNCVTSSRREEYVKELLQHMDIDIVGACSKLFKKSSDKQTASRRKPSGQFKFYLAFENSDCEEYITEKFWKALSNGMIPVVRGRRIDYQKLTPPNSYIHADWFSTAESLAEYLKVVSVNATLFNKYHEWRNYYGTDLKVLTSNREWVCDLCEQVHLSIPKTVDLYDFFSEDIRCFTYQSQSGRNRTGERMENLDSVQP